MPYKARSRRKSARQCRRGSHIIRARAMPGTEVSVQYLLTLPPRMAAEFEALEGRRRPEWFAASDPPGQPLGSGGGTANLLAEAWRATAPAQSFADWLRQSRKLILHAGGLSRRLPAYAPDGQTAHAHPGVPLVARPAPRPIAAGPAIGRLPARAGPRRATHRRPDHQRRRAAALRPRTAALPRGGCARPRHVGGAGKGQGLRRVLLAARPARPNWPSSCRSRPRPKSASWRRITSAWWTPACGC